MTDNPLAKLGDLTKPATVLIEKISDAVGGVFKPYQVVRVAKADVEFRLNLRFRCLTSIDAPCTVFWRKRRRSNRT